MKRRIRNNQPRNYNTKYFTFHSYGTQYRFNPNRIITDDRIVNEANYFESMSQLEFYKNEVRAATQKHVYILDDTGTEVTV